MELSILLLKKTLTLILMILMGYASVKSGKMKSEDSRVISQLCFDWVIPFSMVNAFFIEYTPETARDLGLSCICAAITVLSFVGLTLLLGRTLGLRPSEKGSLMFANSAGMTLPLAESLLGSTGVLLCAPHMGMQNILIFTLLPYIMSGRTEFEWKKILLNRNILSIVAGVVLFVFRIPVPDVLRSTVSGVGSMLAPLSMIMIGMLMAKADLRALLAQKKLYLVCFLRLLGYPMFFIALIALTGVTRRAPYMHDILLVLTMCVASPAATLVTQMAAKHAGAEEAAHAGSLNVLTTLLCVLTIPCMVFVYQILC